MGHRFGGRSGCTSVGLTWMSHLHTPASVSLVKQIKSFLPRGLGRPEAPRKGKKVPELLPLHHPAAPVSPLCHEGCQSHLLLKAPELLQCGSLPGPPTLLPELPNQTLPSSGHPGPSRPLSPSSLVVPQGRGSTRSVAISVSPSPPSGRGMEPASQRCSFGLATHWPGDLSRGISSFKRGAAGCTGKQV